MGAYGYECAEQSARSPGLATVHPAAGEWCVNEVLDHLIEAEQRGCAGRIRIILSADETRLETWDQNEVVPSIARPWGRR